MEIKYGWTADQWEERKDALKTFIQNRINELGIDNELCVPDFVLASAMVESMKMTSVSYRLGKQVATGRHPTNLIRKL